MDTMQLKLFISLSKTLNFTKTANEFYVTQPTVSNYIKSLENNIGVKLLNRDSHSVSLTQEGKEFVGYAKQLIALQMEAENRLRNISEGRNGYLRIAMLSSAAVYFTPCLEEFMQSYPGVQVDVDLLEGSEMISALSKVSHDVFFIHKHMMPSSANLGAIHLGSSQLHLFVHKNMLDQIDTNDWKTLEKFHFVSTPAQDFSLSNQIIHLCASRGIAPDIINYYNRAAMALLAVNAGVGVAILPPQIRSIYNFPNVVALPIEGEDAVIHHGVVWNKRSENPDIANFLRLDALNALRREG